MGTSKIRNYSLTLNCDAIMMPRDLVSNVERFPGKSTGYYYQLMTIVRTPAEALNLQLL